MDAAIQTEQPPAASFSTLPMEIVIAISHYLDRSDKCSLLRISRLLYPALQPLLYRRIVTSFLTPKQMINLMETWISREDLAESVRFLAINNFYRRASGSLGPPQGRREIETRINRLFSSFKLLKNVEYLDITERETCDGPSTTMPLTEDRQWWAFWDIIATMPLKHLGLHLMESKHDLRRYLAKLSQLSSLDLRRSKWHMLPSGGELPKLCILQCDSQTAKSLVPGLSITTLALDGGLSLVDETHWATVSQTVQPVERLLVNFRLCSGANFESILRHIATYFPDLRFLCITGVSDYTPVSPLPLLP